MVLAHHEVPGLLPVPKLKYEHVNLTDFSKMRVILQLTYVKSTAFSSYAYIRPLSLLEVQMQNTHLFFATCLIYFFDCLNVRDYNSGKV